MTKKKLQQIKEFALEFYKKTDQFHDEKHPVLTTKYAFLLAKEFKDVDYPILEAACYLHDIGRTITDEGHPYESAQLADPFLKKIGLHQKEIDEILHAVSIHAAEDILKATTIEAKLLFDADKLQILSVYGFLRVSFFLVAVRKMKMDQAIDLMWKYVNTVWKNHLQTEKAKAILEPEIAKIAFIIKDYKKGLHGKLEMPSFTAKQAMNSARSSSLHHHPKSTFKANPVTTAAASDPSI